MRTRHTVRRRSVEIAFRLMPLVGFLLLISVAALAPALLGTPSVRLGGMSLYLALSILLFIAQVVLVLLPLRSGEGD